VNSASKFNSIVVKTLKPVLCSSRDSVPLKFKKQTFGDNIVYQCGSFEPGFDPCLISLDNPFKGLLCRFLRCVQSCKVEQASLWKFCWHFIIFFQMHYHSLMDTKVLSPGLKKAYSPF
jgi:hypothetical protein